MSIGPSNSTSRYADAKTATFVTADGRTIVYLRRRFVLPPARFVTLQEHRVAEGERLDHIAAKYLGDPEQFWRLCDANNAMRPDELTQTVGQVIRITLPDGIPGNSDA